MVQKDTAPEAHQYAEKEIDLNSIVEQAASEADSSEEAKENAWNLVEDQVVDILEGTNAHLIEDVAQDLGWEASQDAKKEYIDQNLDELVDDLEGE